MNVGSLDELEAALSVASFEATATATFRQDLQSQLSKLLKQCRVGGTASVVYHYNPHHLTLALLEGVEWNQQCQYHDERMGNRSTTPIAMSDLLTTPLNELIKTLLDPRIIPLALSSSLLSVWVQAFLSYTPVIQSETKRAVRKVENKAKGTPAPAYPSVCSRWSPSQVLLLESIQRIMVSRQCRDDLGSIIYGAYKNTFDQKGRLSLEASQSLLSLTKYCARSLEGGVGRKEYYPLSALFPCLLHLLQTIIDPQNGLIDDVKSGRSSWCSSCGKYTDPLLLQSSSKGRKRKRSRMDMGAYHDEEHAMGDDVSQSLSHQRTKHSSLKSIMEAEDDTTGMVCPHCQATMAPRELLGDGQNAKAWCQLRDKCIHSVISFFQSTKQMSRHRAFRLLHETIIFAASRVNPSLRLCVLQMAHSVGRDGYGYLLLTLWNLTFQRNNPKYLAWYAEVIVESSFCDDRQACWDSMQPLVNSIQSRYLEEDSMEAYDDNDKDSEFPNKVLLPCLGYILSRRKTLFRTVEDSLNSDFHSLIEKLSRSCHDITFWVGEKSMDSEKHKPLFNLLVGLGILSEASAEPDKGSSEDTQKQQSSPRSLPQWCDPNPMELRRALERIQWSPDPNGFSAQRGNYRIDPKLLSDLHHDVKLVPPKPVSPSIPLHRYLGDDLLRQVFSFLGYKKLVRLRVVCKYWRALADEDRVWRPLYGARFSMLHDGSPLEENTWKGRFIEKWSFQREIRFSSRSYTYNEQNKTVLKHRCCRYIGCHFVIKKKYQLQQHDTWHKKITMKNKAVLEKAHGALVAYLATMNNGAPLERPRPALVSVGGSDTEETNDANKKQTAVEADVEKSEAQKLHEAEMVEPRKKAMAMAYGLSCAVEAGRVLGVSDKEPYLSYDKTLIRFLWFEGDVFKRRKRL